MGTSFQKLKKLLEKFFLINDSPHKVAAGAALGVFLGIIPGEGVISTLVLASLFRFNRLAATAGILAANMWTTIVFLPIAVATGAFMFRTSSQELIQNFDQTYRLGLKFFLSKIIFLDLLLPLAVGFLVTASVFSLAIYLILYFSLKLKKIKFK